MGQAAAAVCLACGYESNATIGGSIASGFRGEQWPCLCFSCRRVVSALINWETLVCPDCGSLEIEPYGCVSSEVTSRQVHRLRNRAIEDAPYPCPKCGALALRFTSGRTLLN
jgi:predicted RNA-binding Zn-ribbon protein involved in translation (DUF1610 family)